MSFNYDGTGLKPSGGIYTPIPDGQYVLKVTETDEKESKNGDPQVIVHFKVVGGEYNGRQIRFHRVTFFRDKESAGAGIALHFLHCLGEPYEGNFKVDHAKWRGKMVKAQVVSEEYNGNINNKIKGVEALEPTVNAAEIKKEEEIEAIPF